MGISNLNLADGYQIPELAAALNFAKSANPNPPALNLQPTGTADMPPPDAAPPDQNATIQGFNDPSSVPVSQPMPNEVPEPTQQLATPPIDPNAVPTPTGTPTESRFGQLSRESGGFYDFENSPIGSIGRALGQFASGVRGDNNSPQELMQKQKLAETAQQYQHAQLALDAVGKFVDFATKDPNAIPTLGPDFDKNFGFTGVNFSALGNSIKSGKLKDAQQMIPVISQVFGANAIASLIDDKGELNVPLANEFHAVALKALEAKAGRETPTEAGARAGAVAAAEKAVKGPQVFQYEGTLFDETGKKIFEAPKGIDYKVVGADLVNTATGKSIFHSDKPIGPATQGQILGSIAQKVANGEALSAGEQKVWDASHPGSAIDEESIAATAKARAQYKLRPLTARAQQSPAGQAEMAEILKVNPAYDDKKYPLMLQGQKDWLSGEKSGKVLNPINRVSAHLNSFVEYADAVNSGNLVLANKLAQGIASEFGSAKPTNIRMAAAIVGPELLKTVLGTATTGTADERSELSQFFTGHGSPSQQAGAVNVARKFMAAQIQTAQLGYVNDTGDDEAGFRERLVPAAQKILDAESPQKAGAGGVVPDGTTATNAKGETLVKKNGKWVPQ